MKKNMLLITILVSTVNASSELTDPAAKGDKQQFTTVRASQLEGQALPQQKAKRVTRFYTTAQKQEFAARAMEIIESGGTIVYASQCLKVPRGTLYNWLGSDLNTEKRSFTPDEKAALCTRAMEIIESGGTVVYAAKCLKVTKGSLYSWLGSDLKTKQRSYTPDEKREIIAQTSIIIKHGGTIADAALKWQMPYFTLYKWWNKELKVTGLPAYPESDQREIFPKQSKALRSYSKAEKRQYIINAKAMIESKKSVAYAARALGIPFSTLYHWLSVYRNTRKVESSRRTRSQPLPDRNPKQSKRRPT